MRQEIEVASVDTYIVQSFEGMQQPPTRGSAVSSSSRYVTKGLA
jgi:hypothetical protein